jgi:hypothetical protein
VEDDNKHGPTIVALLAVLVTGAVGYAGVVSTREAAQFSERSAEATEIRAARSAREQADVLELRRVVDKAALDLGRLVEAVRIEQETWHNYFMAVHYYHDPNAARRFEREYRRLHSRSTTASANWSYDAPRLDVRLGRQHPLTAFYIDAGGILAALSHAMATCLHGGCGGDEYDRSTFDTVEIAGRYQDKFFEAAAKFVNSQT